MVTGSDSTQARIFLLLIVVNILKVQILVFVLLAHFPYFEKSKTFIVLCVSPLLLLGSGSINIPGNSSQNFLFY
jgi:hypothetical protein